MKKHYAVSITIKDVPGFLNVSGAPIRFCKTREEAVSALKDFDISDCLDSNPIDLGLTVIADNLVERDKGTARKIVFSDERAEESHIRLAVTEYDSCTVFKKIASVFGL